MQANLDSPDALSAAAALRRQWGLAAVLAGLSLAGTALALAYSWAPVYALRWLPLPALGMIYMLAVLWRGLPANRRAENTALLPTLGWGNALTALRGGLTALLAGFLLLPRPSGWLAWAPGVLYTLVCLTDFFDGYVARRTRHVTRLGELLDMSFDGLGVLVAATLAVLYRQVPPWYLLVGLARYLYIAGLWARRRLGWPIHDLPPSLSRRVFAGLQMGFLAVILWPLFAPPGAWLAAALFGLPLLLGFGRDWLYTIGWLRPHRQPGEQTGWVDRWLPVGLRVAAVLLNLGPFARWLAEFPGPTPAQALLGLVNFLVVLLLALGILPHVSAGFALSFLGFYQMLAPLTPAQVALAVIYTLLLYMGGGALCLWAPEHVLYRRRAGEPADASQPEPASAKRAHAEGA